MAQKTEPNVEVLGKHLINFCIENNIKSFRFNRKNTKMPNYSGSILMDDFEKLVMMPCSSCKQIAIFTSEGPNDEYPEPLCKNCEENPDEN